MELRRLNDKGIAAFREYLEALKQDPRLDPPMDLLTKPSTSESLSEPIHAEPRDFHDRMDFACWLHDSAENAGVRVPLRDAGFWAWLSLALFDQVCPAKKQGERPVKEISRYIPMLSDRQRYYRHALLGPYLVFDAYNRDPFEPDQVAPLLCGSLDKLTDEAYRLFVENGLVAYPCAVSILTDLYFDEKRNRLRRGAQTKKPGTIRHLTRVLSQYARTYDLDVLPKDKLAGMLPAEFNRWRNKVTRSDTA